MKMHSGRINVKSSYVEVSASVVWSECHLRLFLLGRSGWRNWQVALELHPIPKRQGWKETTNTKNVNTKSWICQVYRGGEVRSPLDGRRDNPCWCTLGRTDTWPGLGAWGQGAEGAWEQVVLCKQALKNEIPAHCHWVHSIWSSQSDVSSCIAAPELNTGAAPTFNRLDYHSRSHGEGWGSGPCGWMRIGAVQASTVGVKTAGGMDVQTLVTKATIREIAATEGK